MVVAAAVVLEGDVSDVVVVADGSVATENEGASEAGALQRHAGQRSQIQDQQRAVDEAGRVLAKETGVSRAIHGTIAEAFVVVEATVPVDDSVGFVVVPTEAVAAAAAAADDVEPEPEPRPASPSQFPPMYEHPSAYQDRGSNWAAC